MASEAPLSGGEPTKEYEGRWTDIGRLMLDRWSWSGRERDNLYLNLGHGRFVDASAASGLDFVEDGRALATLDWDGDGRMDAFLRNRNAPGIRFLHGNAPREHHWISFSLRGVKSNRDAIGARLSVRAAGQVFTRELRAGDGYLAQSSKRIHFGLGAVEKVDSVHVRWPSGLQEEHPALALNTHYNLTEGSAPAARAARTAALANAEPVLISARPQFRMVLRTPLPLPPHLMPAEKSPAGGATAFLVPGRDPIANAALLEDLLIAPERLKAAELHIALASDSEDDLAQRLRSALATEFASVRSAAHAASWQAIHQQLLGPAARPEAPTVFLVDAAGLLQSIWWGRVHADQLLADATVAGVGNNTAAPRAGYPGRWYYGHLPDIAGLADTLRRTGDGQAVAFYVLLAEDLRRRTNKR